MKSTNKHLSSAHITEMFHGRYVRVYAIYTCSHLSATCTTYYTSINATYIYGCMIVYTCVIIRIYGNLESGYFELMTRMETPL